MPKFCESCGQPGAEFHRDIEAVLCTSCFDERQERMGSGRNWHHREVPNVDEPGRMLDDGPTLIPVYMVIYDTEDNGRLWFDEAMDKPAAERLATAINAAEGAYAQVVEIPLILPASGDILDALGHFKCEPLRVKMTESWFDCPIRGTNPFPEAGE